MVTLVVLPFNTPVEALKMVEEFADTPGVIGYCVTSTRYKPVHANEYMKLYRAIEETGKPIAFHAGYHWQDPSLATCNTFLGMHSLGFTWCNIVHMTNWVLNGIPERFPKLKSIWVESGLSWIPFLMQRLDDQYLMRQSDLVLMLPSLPFLFIISAFAELQVWHLAVVLGTLGGLGGSVITIKSQALQVKVKPFVDSARITVGSKRRIMFSHILPNVAPLALLYMVFSVTGAIASESVLSFLGLLNIDMSWGIMIYLAQTEGFIFTGLKYWWLILPAGLSVTLLAGGFYLVGRGLDDVFNPRLRRR